MRAEGEEEEELISKNDRRGVCWVNDVDVFLRCQDVLCPALVSVLPRCE